MNNIPVMVFEPTSILDLGDLYLSLPEEQHSVLQQLEDIIKQQSLQIQFDRQVFSLLGVDKSILSHAFRTLEQWRTNLKEPLESPDEEIREKAITKLSQKTIESLMPLLNDKRFNLESQLYEEQVKEELSTPVWNMIAEESRSFLITAHFTFDQISALQRDDCVDYSCVCLLAAKALELETTIRFYDGYIQYLHSQHISLNYWPFALTNRNCSPIEVIERSRYSLGSVLHTAGLKDVSNAGEIPCLEVSHRPSFRYFCNYYHDILLKPNFRGSVSDKIIDDCSFIEIARTDYRNPSAHKNTIDRVCAQKCLEYLLTVEKKLFHMLKDMRE